MIRFSRTDVTDFGLAADRLKWPREASSGLVLAAPQNLTGSRHFLTGVQSRTQGTGDFGDSGDFKRPPHTLLDHRPE